MAAPLNCLSCTAKSCRTAHADCNGNAAAVTDLYRNDGLTRQLVNADALVADGRAGTLSRVDEIIEYAQAEGIDHIAVAYCFGIHEQATMLRGRLQQAGLRTSSVQCTVNGIPENDLTGNGKDAVNCNPAGQAMALNKSDAGLVVEMGLCIGHDVIFHRYLKKPFTVFMVKDRVYNHVPQRALQPEPDPAATFLGDLPSDFNLRTPDKVEQMLADGVQPTIVDLRAPAAFTKGALPGSVNVLLADLPSRYTDQLPDKNAAIVMLCNGGLQSLYAVMFLRMHGYTAVYSLTGGYSRWEREERRVVAQDVGYDAERRNQTDKYGSNGH